MSNKFEFNDSFSNTAKQVFGGGVYDGRKLSSDGGRGNAYVNHVRRINMRITATLNLSGSIGDTVTVKPDALFGNLTFTVPGAPNAAPIQMPVQYLIALHRLENFGSVPPAYLDGAATPSLWDGTTITLAATTEAHVFQLQVPLNYFRAAAADPMDSMFPTTILANAGFQLAYNAIPANARLAHTGSGAVASISNGTAVLSFEMEALSKVIIPAWSIWLQDSLTTLQPSGIQTVDGITVASGFFPQASVPAVQFQTGDINALGYSSSGFLVTQAGLPVNTWYDSANEDFQIGGTQFINHTISMPPRSQPFPLVWTPRSTLGQRVSSESENASFVVKPVFDAYSGTPPYVLIRRIAMSHGANGENLNTLKQAAGISPAAQGQQQFSSGQSATANKRAKATAPFHYAVSSLVRR